MHTGSGHRRGGEAEPSGVAVTSDDDGSVLQVAVWGRWNWRLALAMQTAVSKCLAEHPSAMIMDLCRVDDPEGTGSAQLVIAYRAGRAMQPPVPVAICVASGGPLEVRLRSRGAGRFMLLFPSLTLARAALEQDLVVPDHVELGLEPVTDAARRARRLVAEAGHGWELPQLVDPATIIMSELVTNVVRHVGTHMFVSVRRRGRSLGLAVCDGSSVLPPPPGASHPGYGLRLVDQIAAAWGSVLTHRQPGKIVWAVLGVGQSGDKGTSLYRESLSAREQEVLEQLPMKSTAEDIAARLGVSVHTVKAHLRSIYRKLGVSRRQDAVAEAIRRGLL